MEHVRRLEIRHFKSIRELTLDCRRINLFIGEPNTGKSNILESLGLLSFGGYGKLENFKEFVRHEEIPDLFYDEDIHTDITIHVDRTQVC